MARPPIPAPERFWQKVAKTTTCWNWTGWINENGYGHFGINNRKTVKAHRYAYELLVGPIGPGLVIDHLCHNRKCVNPVHLAAVVFDENQRRAIASRVRQAREARKAVSA